MINRLLAEVVGKLDYEPLDFSGFAEEDPAVLVFLESVISRRFGLRKSGANPNYRKINRLFESHFNDVPVILGITTLNLADSTGHIDAIMMESAPHYDDIDQFAQEEATAYLLRNGMAALYYKPRNSINGIVNAASLRVDGRIILLDRFDVKAAILADLNTYGILNRPLEKIDPLVNSLAMLSEVYANSSIHREAVTLSS